MPAIATGWDYYIGSILALENFTIVAGCNCKVQNG